MRNTQNHTTGPWEVQPEESPVIIARHDASHPSGAIAKLYGNHEHAWADAALIKAAPDLLNALVACEYMASAGWVIEPGSSLHHAIKSAIKMARARLCRHCGGDHPAGCCAQDGHGG